MRNSKLNEAKTRKNTTRSRNCILFLLLVLVPAIMWLILFNMADRNDPDGIGGLAVYALGLLYVCIGTPLYNTILYCVFTIRAYLRFAFCSFGCILAAAITNYSVFTSFRLPITWIWQYVTFSIVATAVLVFIVYFPCKRAKQRREEL